MTQRPSSWLTRFTARVSPKGDHEDEEARLAAAQAGLLATTARHEGTAAGQETSAGAETAQDGSQLTVTYAVRATAAWSWRLVVITAAAVILGFLFVTFKMVAVAFVVAVLLAVLLQPVAAWMRRALRFPGALAAAFSMLLTFGAVTGLLVLAGRSIALGFASLADKAVDGFNQTVAWLSDGPLGIEREQVDSWLDEGLGAIEDNASVLANGVLQATSSVTQVFAGAVIALFCLFFFLKDGRMIWQWFVRLTPVAARDQINEAGIRSWLTLGGYARTQILVALADAVGIGVGAAILGVPLALPLGVLVFLGSFIPIVGAIATGIVAILVALVDQGPVTALLMVGVVLVVQQLESNLLQPWLMGNAVSLHPVAVLLAVAAGTGVAGVLGALLSVPVAAVINTVFLYLNGHDKHQKAAGDWHRPGGPPGVLFRAIADSYGASTTADSGATGTRAAPGTAAPGAEPAVAGTAPESVTGGGQHGATKEPRDG